MCIRDSYTGEDIAHYAKMGAAGAQLATRFIPTYECDASQTYKDVLLAAKPEDVRIIHSPCLLYTSCGSWCRSDIAAAAWGAVTPRGKEPASGVVTARERCYTELIRSDEIIPRNQRIR